MHYDTLEGKRELGEAGRGVRGNGGGGGRGDGRERRYGSEDGEGDGEGGIGGEWRRWGRGEQTEMGGNGEGMEVSDRWQALTKVGGTLWRGCTVRNCF